jgi:hypothetical protein
MSFLYLEKDQVKVTADGMALPAVQSFYAGDNSAGKKRFFKAMKYIYYVYNKDGVLRNKLPEDRKKIVCNTYLDAIDPEVYEKSALVRPIIDLYIDYSISPTELLYEQLKIDIQNIRKKISSIPFDKEIKLHINELVDIDITDEETGNTYTKKIPVSKDVYINIDNSKEKAAAIALTESLFIQEERLRKLIEKENIENKARRIFDIR